MRLVCVFAALLACSAATAAFDSIHDVCLQRPSSHANKVSLLMELCPAELETIPANAYGSRSKPSVLAAHPWPWSNTFYQSIPANLTAFNLSTAQTPPVFAVLGDAMGALGFQMCDIEHYLDHENHTLAPCQDRAGWASKVAGAYDDKLWLFHHMIRSTDNAKRVVVPLVFNQFDNNTTQLKLVVVAIGSKYGKSAGFAEPLAALTRSMLSRGIKVVLMTRPPINTAAPAPLWFNNYNTTTAGEINAAIRSVAAETGAACLDTWELIMATGDAWKDALGRDGIHYSAVGQQLVYDGFMRLIEAQFPSLSPSRIFTETPSQP